MTRFGMKEDDFAQLAEYMSQIILHDRSMAKEISQFRKKFMEMRYCLTAADSASLLEELIEVIR